MYYPSEIGMGLGILIYPIKFFMLIIWGLYVCIHYRGGSHYKDADGNTTPNNYFVAYSIILYSVVNELLIWPIVFLKIFFYNMMELNEKKIAEAEEDEMKELAEPFLVNS